MHLDFRAFKHGNWHGILDAVLGSLEGSSSLGSRADEFADRERYLWLEDDDLLRIIDRRDGLTRLRLGQEDVPLNR